jgi:hypothetical protein
MLRGRWRGREISFCALRKMLNRKRGRAMIVGIQRYLNSFFVRIRIGCAAGAQMIRYPV